MPWREGPIRTTPAERRSQPLPQQATRRGERLRQEQPAWESPAQAWHRWLPLAWPQPTAGLSQAAFPAADCQDSGGKCCPWLSYILIAGNRPSPRATPFKNYLIILLCRIMRSQTLGGLDPGLDRGLDPGLDPGLDEGPNKGRPIERPPGSGQDSENARFRPVFSVRLAARPVEEYDPKSHVPGISQGLGLWPRAKRDSK